MTTPRGPVGTPKYNSFCVSHVHLGGDKPGCRIIQHAGLNMPDDYAARGRLMDKYPGSTLQAPACRAIAANLMRLNRTGLQASHLLSQLGLNITVHNAMNGERLPAELCCCMLGRGKRGRSSLFKLCVASAFACRCLAGGAPTV
jgi:hypothetical protein